MSDQQSVWPDGAREAVEAAYRFLWTRKPNVRPPLGDTILTALEPFVQQRIEAARHEEIAGYDQGYQDGESNAVADWSFALNEIGGFPDDFDYSPTTVAAEVARLREDGERLDWMDQQRPNAMGGSRVSLFRPVTDMVQDRAIGYGPTYRAAIDDARSAPGGEG